jgi:hypothetical protein
MLKKMVLNLPRLVMCPKNITVVYTPMRPTKPPTLKETAKTKYQQR